MQTRTTAALALAALIAAGGSAMAASKMHRSGNPYAMTQQERSLSAARAQADVYASDGYVEAPAGFAGDVYATAPGADHPWGTSIGSASQTYYNPALDRAKGNLD